MIIAIIIFSASPHPPSATLLNDAPCWSTWCWKESKDRAIQQQPHPKIRYTPSRFLSIDEIVIGFKGRFLFLQFNTTKLAKHHIKAFGLTDSSSGYVLNFLIYFGANTSYDPMSADLGWQCHQDIWLPNACFGAWLLRLYSLLWHGTPPKRFWTIRSEIDFTSPQLCEQTGRAFLLPSKDSNWNIWSSGTGWQPISQQWSVHF